MNRMSARSILWSAVAVSISLCAHAVGFSASWLEEESAKVEGAQEIQIAAIGGSFEDLVRTGSEQDLDEPAVEPADTPNIAQSQQPSIPDISAEKTPVEVAQATKIEPTRPVEATPQLAQRPKVSNNQQPEPNAPEPVNSEPIALQEPISQAAASVANSSVAQTPAVLPSANATADNITAAAPTISNTSSAPELTNVESTPPSITSKQAEQTAALTAPAVKVLKPKEETLPMIAPLPRPSPRAPEVQTKKVPKKKAVEPKRKVKEKPKRKSTASKGADNGNTTKVNAKKGRADGQKKGRSAANNRGKGKSKSAGNARASNYPGLVRRKVARTRRGRAGGKGVAVVRFRVSASGGLSSVSIARSSGNRKLDQAAVSHIRRSAPFPKPPKGASRSFALPIEFRR
mgnify:CR=1 FL=1